ncbi:DNA-binding protein [Priestia aryabhattai]|nr:DNA-binding protein [Priestia aryabhattai]
MTVYEIAEKFFNQKASNSYFINNLKRSILDLPSNYGIKIINLSAECYEEKYKRNIQEIYYKKDVERFFRDWVSKSELVKELGKSVSNFTIHKYYKQLNLAEINIGNKLDVFILKIDAEKLKSIINRVKIEGSRNWQMRSYNFEKYKGKLGYLSSKEVMDKLKCSAETIRKLIKEESLVVAEQYEERQLFNKDQVDRLQRLQLRLIEDYAKYYYTSKQIQQKYNDSFAHYVKGSEDRVRRKIDKVNPPTLLISYYGVQMNLYKKEEIDSLWRDYKLYKDMNSVSMDDPFQDFVFKVEHVLHVQFTKRQYNTKQLWYQFVERFFIKTRISDKSRITFEVNQFARCTQLMFQIFDREIYSYSEEDINYKFLNDTLQIRRSYQRHFYTFLKKVINTFSLESLPVPYNIKNLNDPWSFKKLKETSTDIYSLEEYQALYNHTNRIKYHKKKAIIDVKNLIRTKDYTKYKNYDSCWLYVLILLTNNWRHSTVLSQIPRVDLSTTSIRSLEWLEENEPSEEDANSLIYQVGRYITKIAKTGAIGEDIFNIGEPLKIAFATSISICEFRRRETLDSSSTLIELPSHLVKRYNPHKEFFIDFSQDFKFENRKINRTVSTLIWSVLRHMGKGLKEAQLSRMHLSDTTTINHYIKLSDSQVKTLVDELFTRNQFGFVTQALTNIVFGIEADKSIETKRMVEVNKLFGDVGKIEATAGLINRISNQQEEVVKYLNEFNLDEIRNIFYQANMNMLPSKQRYYQCLYSECKYKNENGQMPDCNSCAASIINVYALENIMNHYVFMMDKIDREFESVPLGEKYKLANQFFLLHKTVTQARKKFGREAVDGFVEGGTATIKSLGDRLSARKLKQLITHGVLQGDRNGQQKS